ncbi:MAG: hypothetical protein ACJ74Y_18620, partial [Bryobacteraceae bacterium]
MNSVQQFGRVQQNPEVECAHGSLIHLLVELKRVDQLIQAQVDKLRHAQTEKDEYRGLFISEQEVDALLANSDQEWPGAALERGSASEIDQMPQRCGCRFFELGRLFGLNQFDLDAVLVCLAPELDRRYERLYGYLQDDITKRRPSVDLILNLLCPSFETKLANRHRLLAAAPLLSERLIQVFDDPSQPQPTLLGQFVRVDERIVSYLLGSDDIDPRLRGYSHGIAQRVSFEELGAPDGYRKSLINVTHFGDRSVVLYLQSASGADRRMTAAAVCHELRLPLFAIEGKRLLGISETDFRQIAGLAFREAVLQKSAFYWADFDAFLGDEKSTLLNSLMSELEKRKGLTFLAGENAWD